VTDDNLGDWVCEECGTGYNSEAAANACQERCAGNDDLTGYEPSRGKLSYRLGYD
jgi:hypothetical protein